MRKSLIPVIAVMLAATACSSGTPDPVAVAIEQAAMKDAGDDYTFRINELAKLDSTTFRTEIERRKEVFRLKYQAEEKLCNRYLSEKKPKNAEIHRQAMENARHDIEIMDDIGRELESILDDVAYYDYVFSGYSQTADGRVNYNNVYVTITPDNEVLTMTSNQKDLHKGTGKVIPGYVTIISSESGHEAE